MSCRERSTLFDNDAIRGATGKQIGIEAVSEFIYIVDDDDIVRDVLRTAMLQQQNRHVQCFTSGDAFLADLPGREPGVLVLDIQMPGSSGLDVLKRLSEETKRFETIVLTASGKIAVAVEAMKYGACDFVEKPFELEHICSRIDEAFALFHADYATNRQKNLARAQLASLSSREHEVFSKLANGKTNKVVAYELNISVRTVETHRSAVLDKLQVTTLAEAVLVATHAGFLQPQALAEIMA